MQGVKSTSWCFLQARFVFGFGETGLLASNKSEIVVIFNTDRDNFGNKSANL